MTQQLDHRTNGGQLAPRVPQATRTGQATAVEQSRAVAEVEAAIVVALRHPRDIERAVADMQRSCAQKSLAEKAFFRYSRGGGQISGPSVQLARELARSFGNIQYGIVEMRRDDEYGQSEMQAWCWDVQTNTRSSTIFVVPHIRDTSSGPKPLVDMRDIYEQNANMGARRLREMIFAIMPGWFTEDAVAACYRTLQGDDSDESHEQRLGKCIQLFSELGVTSRQLVQKLGSPVDKWTPYDLATLTVIYRSLQRGEIRKEEEFGDPGLTSADILGDAPAAPAQPVARAHEATPAAPAEDEAPPLPEAPEPAAETTPDAARETPGQGPASDQAAHDELNGGPFTPSAVSERASLHREPVLDDKPGTITKEQQARLWSVLSTKHEFTRDDRAQSRQACEQIIGRKLTGGTTGNLSEKEASSLIDTLEAMSGRAELIERLAQGGPRAGSDEQ